MTYNNSNINRLWEKGELLRFRNENPTEIWKVEELTTDWKGQQILIIKSTRRELTLQLRDDRLTQKITKISAKEIQRQLK